MESNLEQRIKKYEKQHKRKKIWTRILSALSAVVVFCTTYALILPAITQERDVFCGKEEHIHSAECFEREEKILICELSEEEAHLHSEECFEKTLICENTEEEHIHTDECYENILICELSESEGHLHGDECFEIKTVFCQVEEHFHSLLCYSDANADVETEEQWKAGFAFAEFGEETSENLLAVAQSQLGYHESTKNYIVLEDGETIKGRTRYGEWFGEPYSDWGAVFVGFCLEYANSDIPFDADFEKWKEILSAPENDIYRAKNEHEPLAGDIIFFDSDVDGKPDKAGIISEINENEYKVIIGDYGDSVQAVLFLKTDETIIGFAKIAEPSPYLCGLEEHIHKEKCFDELGSIVCGFDEHTHDGSCLEEKQEEPKEPEETEGKEETEYFCETEEHTHSEECFDENENLVCTKEEHTHTEDCLSEKPEEEYFCGMNEHEHSEECFDESENLICETAEHVHSEECKISFENLPEEEKIRIEQVITMIDSLPTPDEIDEKIMEFEDAEDYEAEEIWLTEIYQKVGITYKYYTDLPENHRKFVTNSEKLMELEYIWSVAFLIETEIGKTAEYSADMFSSGQFIIYTRGANGYYAINGSGAAVLINITDDGIITANVGNKNELLWTLSGSNGTFKIKNVSSGRYLHAFANNGGGVTTTGEYSSTFEETEGGIKIRSNTTDYARLDEENKTFRRTGDPSEAAVYNIGTASSGKELYVWLDGTWGGLDFLSGSEDSVHTVIEGGTIILPTEWQTPSRYNYKVRGWYDIVAKKYYEAGAEAVIEANTVFYPDWVPATYNIGQFTAETSNTVSTSKFITTHVFDYSPFYNLQYVEATNVTINSQEHSERWRLPNENDFIFRNYSGSPVFSCPDNGQASGSVNGYIQNSPTTGILNAELTEKLFGRGNNVIGKTYLGTGDYLFQYCDDPANTEYYGYYYYDSSYHAASYNQAAQRFYVYDYLEATSDNTTADFLPLNSPYANTNGNKVETYSDNGQYNEYQGVTHYRYTNNGVAAEYWFGIHTDISFFLANTPGEKDPDGNNVNQGMNGKDLVFEFTGDDDVWVLVDGKVVLDIGGIHQAVEGSINFSTGEVVVNGKTQPGVTNLAPGEHTLTMYYLERGAGDSNCKIKFNITTRYGLTLQKEDVLTRDLLNGAEFTVYSDKACTKEAFIWKSHADYESGGTARSTFVVENGKTTMWGLAAGNTYYVKETKYPTNGGYGVANGIIVIKLNSEGSATFDVIPDETADGSDLSGGFTVHGYKIDVENHEVNLVATNSKEEYGDEVTSVTVMKKWSDVKDHSNDSVTVYILANDVRIQETVLSESNGWTHTWKNLPVNGESGKPVIYTVEEGTVSGYFGNITTLESSETEITEWKETSSISSGKAYLLKTSNGYLCAENGVFRWVTEEEAKNNPGAQWVITLKQNYYYLSNRAGQNIYHANNIFNAGTSSASAFSFSSGRFGYRSGNKTYYPTGIDKNGRLTRSSSSSSALKFTLYYEETTTQSIKIDGLGFLITNDPITVDNSVSFKVNKKWVSMGVSEESYQQFVVKVKLLENGKDSGMTGELSLKNGWTYTFVDLPKFDSGGKEISYSVEETWYSKDWEASYGEITKDGNTFVTTITNTYIMRYKLPETGGSGNIISIIGGILILGAGSALIYNKKRGKEDTS